MGKVDIASKVWLHEAAGDIARLVLHDEHVNATAVGSVTLPSVETGLPRALPPTGAAWHDMAQ